MIATPPAALVAAATIVASTLVPAAPSVAAEDVSERPRWCNLHSYDTKVRFVKGSTDIGISRMWVHTYPGDTTIHRGDSIETNHRRTFAARVSSTVGASIGAEAMLKKVVGVFAEVQGESSYRMRIGTTKYEKRTVTVGRKVVTGAFEYSSCNALDGHDQDTGVVKWRKSAWSSFAIRDDGGQRCDLAANTSVAKAAKKIGCDA